MPFFEFAGGTYVPTCSMSEILRFHKITFLKNDAVFSLNCFEESGVSKVKNNAFWGSWTFPLGPQIFKNEDLLDFGEVNIENY